MFNPIECRLTPSRLAPGLTFGPVVLLGVLGWFAGVDPVWLLSALAVTLYVLRHSHCLEPPIRYLRWHGDRVVLYTDFDLSDPEPYQWTGRGRRNSLYIRLELLTETRERRDQTIWRDSVSDASWRALNAAYRVNAAATAR